MTRRGAGRGTGVVDTEGREEGRGGERERKKIMYKLEGYTQMYMYMLHVSPWHTQLRLTAVRLSLTLVSDRERE